MLNLYRSNHWTIFLRFAAIPVIHAFALLGDTEQARSLLAEIDAMGFPPSDESGADLLRSRAWTDVAAGDIAAARRRLREAVEMSSVTGDTPFGVAALHDLARLGATDVVPRLAELVAGLEGDLFPVLLVGATARAGRDVEALEHAITAYDGIGAWLWAAECAAEASVLLRQHGQLRRAAALECRAQALALRCPGVRTPGLSLIAARAALTPRELEIARLAAAGLANREIGERLFLSVRTVENRLHAVYEKLGIEGRAELTHSLAQG